ncbi:hypothetical protein [Roseivivax sp. CAU 1753]
MTAPLRAPAIPPKGLSLRNFSRVGEGGLGDGHNNYAHSMAWFKGRLYLGTTRSNMCMLRFQSAFAKLPLTIWPVDCPDTMDGLYKLDRRSQIWAFDPVTGKWDMTFRAPMVDGLDGRPVPREIGYRSMAVYQGPTDPEPALYVSAWAPGRAPGGLILRSYDGTRFDPVTPYGVIDPPFSVTRSLTTFRGAMHFAPTAQRGTTGGQQNATDMPLIYGSATPEAGDWQTVNPPGFDDPGNKGIFSLAVANDQLYAGTLNLDGLQVWATDGTPADAALGPYPYRWRKVIDRGAGRGPLNQAVACMTAFNGALYVGTGIQGGGLDRVNNVGPAAAEVLRINADDSVDVIVGDRDDDGRAPLSGLKAGFGNFFNGYMWSMGVHDGWLYCGSYDWSVTLRWAIYEQAPRMVRGLLDRVGAETIVENEGGADLWRSADGENWMPVTRRGFDNPYNWGIRNLVSTPSGLFVGTANVFGPRVAVRDDAKPDGWAYADNPRGGLEVWLGQPNAPAGTG